MKKTLIIAAIVGMTALSGCSDASTARRVLEENGYSNIKITGHAWFTCADSDDFSTGFEATAPGGRHVTGAVCSGFFKGATIRF